MISSELLLEQCSINIAQLTHINFPQINTYWAENKDEIYASAIKKIENELQALFLEGIDKIDPRRLAAIFRRGDLLLKLQ